MPKTLTLFLALCMLAGCSDNPRYARPEIDRLYQQLKLIDSTLIKKIAEHDTFAVNILREEQRTTELKYKESLK